MWPISTGSRDTTGRLTGLSAKRSTTRPTAVSVHPVAGSIGLRFTIRRTAGRAGICVTRPIGARSPTTCSYLSATAPGGERVVTTTCIGSGGTIQTCAQRPSTSSRSGNGDEHGNSNTAGSRPAWVFVVLISVLEGELWVEAASEPSRRRAGVVRRRRSGS